MAEWHSKGMARYGPAKFLSLTNCDFIGDNTCVTISTTEASGETGDPMHYTSVTCVQLWVILSRNYNDNVLIKTSVSVCGPWAGSGKCVFKSSETASWSDSIFSEKGLCPPYLLCTFSHFKMFEFLFFTFFKVFIDKGVEECVEDGGGGGSTQYSQANSLANICEYICIQNL